MVRGLPDLSQFSDCKNLFANADKDSDFVVFHKYLFLVIIKDILSLLVGYQNLHVPVSVRFSSIDSNGLSVNV